MHKTLKQTAADQPARAANIFSKPAIIMRRRCNTWVVKLPAHVLVGVHNKNSIIQSFTVGEGHSQLLMMASHNGKGKGLEGGKDSRCVLNLVDILHELGKGRGYDRHRFRRCVCVWWWFPRKNQRTKKTKCSNFGIMCAT